MAAAAVMQPADLMATVREEAAFALASTVAGTVREQRGTNQRLGHTWKFPPAVVRAVVFIQACMRRRDYLIRFGLGDDDAYVDEDIADFSEPRPLLAVALYFCRRMRNPNFVDVPREANAVAGIIRAKEKGISMQDVLNVINFYSDAVPEGHFSLVMMHEKLHEMVVEVQEGIQAEVAEMDSPGEVQRAIDASIKAYQVPPELHERCYINARLKLAEVKANSEAELRADGAASATTLEIDNVKEKLERLFGPVQTEVREEMEVLKARRIQFLETELETRWSRPFVGPLPPHSLAARRYEQELGTDNPKVQGFVQEEQRYASALEAAFEVRMNALQKRIKELVQKRNEARARSLAQDYEERLSEAAQEVQNTIEAAIIQIGPDHPKVQKRANEFLDPEAHSSIYAIQAERTAEELRAELAHNDPSPEAGDRRRSLAATLDVLLGCLDRRHHLQEPLREEFAVQLAEVARARAALEAAGAVEIPELEGLDDDDLTHPDSGLGKAAAAPVISRELTLEADEEEDDGWGAPPGFSNVVNAEEQKAVREYLLPNGGLPDFAFDEAPPEIKPDADAVAALDALAGPRTPSSDEPVHAELGLQNITLDGIRAHTEAVFGNKVTRSVSTALSIPRQRVLVDGFEDNPVRAMLRIREPEVGEPPGRDSEDVLRRRPLKAVEAYEELNTQVTTPGSKLCLGELGPFLTGATLERGAGGTSRKMQHGSLAGAYSATKLGEKSEQPHTRSLALMSTVEPTEPLGTVAASDLGITWGASRLEPGSLHAGQTFRTTCPDAPDDPTTEPWAAPVNEQPLYTFYDQKAEERSRDLSAKIPQRKFATHANFHLTRHPAGGTAKLKGVAAPGQPHIAAMSWLENAEDRLQLGELRPHTAQDGTKPEAGAKEGDKTGSTLHIPQAGAEGDGGETPVSGRRGRDVSPKPRRGKSETKEFQGVSDQSEGDTEKRPTSKGSRKRTTRPSSREDGDGLSPPGSGQGSRKSTRTPKASGDKTPVETTPAETPKPKPPRPTPVERSRKQRLVDEEDSDDQAPPNPEAGKKAHRLKALRSASAKEARVQSTPRTGPQPTQDSNSPKMRLDPSLSESIFDSSSCYAGMYGGMPGTGCRKHHEGNERLPSLVGRPTSDQLKTPAYVRNAYRHGTVGYGPPYRTFEEGQEGSPVWTALQMLDGSLEQKDWQRSYAMALKLRGNMRLGPRDGIRELGRSVSLPRFPPSNRRPRVSSSGRKRPDAKPTPEPQPDQNPAEPPLAPEETPTNPQGTAIPDEIDVGELEAAQQDETPSPRSHLVMGRYSLVLVSALLAGAAAQPQPDESAVSAFEDFVQKFDRQYASEEERRSRFTIFERNFAYIQSENAKGHSYALGVNEFADMSSEEFQAHRLGLRAPAGGVWEGLPHLGTHHYSGKALASDVDWTSKGAVTPVKNQGQCGSCWSFSTTGALEGAWQIASGKLVSLSEQQLVDCSHDGNQGCQGGEMDAAFKYLESNPSCTEDSYPYQAKAGTCQQSSCTVGVPQGSVTGFKDVATDDEQALMEAVSKQPVSVAIEADQMAFQLYKSGVLSKACGDKLDHGVLVVGYGTDNGVDFWKVKNSWGASWGEEGYVRLARGKGSAGECGILSQPSYPVVSGSPSPGPSPTPPPSPPSPPTPPTPSSSHYEKPPCRSDEMAARVQGADGVFCAPHCGFLGSCSKDTPSGTTAKPQCALRTQEGQKYCALVCQGDDECPTGATCASVDNNPGICLYPDSVVLSFQEHSSSTDLVV